MAYETLRALSVVMVWSLGLVACGVVPIPSGNAETHGIAWQAGVVSVIYLKDGTKCAVYGNGLNSAAISCNWGGQ